MKKLLTLFVFALGALSANAQSTLKGDVDGDGNISVTDVAMIVNHILGVNDDNFIIANADINGDGEIDINDVMAAVSTILGDNNGNDPGFGDTSQAYFTCPNDNHPHIIDLGLSSGTKWACCNVGAEKPEDYGGYYAWGETNEKSEYSHVSYQYNTGVDVDGDGFFDDWHDDTLTYGLWQNLGNCIGVDENGESIYDIAGTQYDVAHVLWGGKWQMPTNEQIRELLSCYNRWISINDVPGGEFIGSHNNYIFLPAGGELYPGNYTDVGGGYGCYWTSTQSSPYSACADFLYFEWRYGWCYTNYWPNCRSDGYLVRPVWVP